MQNHELNNLTSGRRPELGKFYTLFIDLRLSENTYKVLYLD